MSSLEHPASLPSGHFLPSPASHLPLHLPQLAKATLAGGGADPLSLLFLMATAARNHMGEPETHFQVLHSEPWVVISVLSFRYFELSELD